MPKLTLSLTLTLTLSPNPHPVTHLNPSPSPGPEPSQVRACASWALLARHALPLGDTSEPEASPVVSAQLEPQLEPASALPRRRRLLACRASGEALQWGLPALATKLAEGGAVGGAQGVQGVQPSGKERSRARKLDYTEAVQDEEAEAEKEEEEEEEVEEKEAAAAAEVVDEGATTRATSKKNTTARTPTTSTTRSTRRRRRTSAARAIADGDAPRRRLRAPWRPPSPWRRRRSDEGCVAECETEDAPRTRVPVALSLGLRPPSRPIHAPSPAPSPAAAAAAAAGAYAKAAEAAAGGRRAASTCRVWRGSTSTTRSHPRAARARAGWPALSGLAAPKLNGCALVEQQLAARPGRLRHLRRQARRAPRCAARTASTRASTRRSTASAATTTCYPRAEPPRRRACRRRRRDPRWHARRSSCS